MKTAACFSLSTGCLTACFCPHKSPIAVRGAQGMGRGAIGGGTCHSVRPTRKEGDIEGRSTVNRRRIAGNGYGLLYVLTMAGIFRSGYSIIDGF